MKVRVTEQGVVIPKQWLEGVDEVEIRQEQNVIVVVPIGNGNHAYELDTLLAGVTAENLHAEVDTGDPVGNEVW